MGRLFRTFLFLVLTGVQLMAAAQNTIADKQDFMTSNGKIYIVVAVVLTILAGLLFYLVRLDRKISKLEKEHP